MVTFEICHSLEKESRNQVVKEIGGIDAMI